MKHKSLVYIILFMFLSVLSVHASDISAVGYGATEAEARANAVSELSFVIYSDVKSSLKTDMSSDPENEKSIVTKQVDITSAVPVYAAAYTLEPVTDGFKATAVLRSGSAVPVYEKELERTIDHINRVNRLIKSSRPQSEKYTLVMSAMSHFENMIKLKAVMSVLGVDAKKYPDVTLEELYAVRRDLTESTDSLTHAAQMVASELNRKRVFVYYPMYKGSDEVTQFAEVFRDMLAKEFRAAESIADADFFLETSYTDTEKGIYISATLTDKNSIVQGKSVKHLLKTAYAGLVFKPNSLSFEKLLKLGLAKQPDFKVRVSTANGKKTMLYRAGDSVEIFVKLNSPGYFFMVGHVDKAGERYSYLVDFYNTLGNRKFVRTVSGDEINRWVSLGEFDVVPPFGLETFQVIATVKDPVDSIPAHVFDTETELYIVSRDIGDGVALSRALKRKPENINASAEDILIFSTTDK